MLEVVNLACTRGDRPLFRGVSFTLQPGQLLHVQGPNGSGKTTLLRTLCGLSRPAHGEIRWSGRSVSDNREDFLTGLCYIGHANALHGDLTGSENLGFEAGLTAQGGAPRKALAEAGLARVTDLPTKLLSQGQRRRSALARLLLDARRLWVLDEPLTALDVHATARLLDLFVRHLQRDGMIVLTSHQEITLSDWPVLTLTLEAL